MPAAERMTTVIQRASVSGNYLVIAAGSACLLAVGASSRSWLGRWQLPFVNTLTLLAYSLYLIHKMAFKVVRTSAGPWLQDHGVAAFFLCALAALLVGGLLYLLIERPFLAIRNHVTKGKRGVEVSLKYLNGV